MAEKRKIKAVIVSQECITEGIYNMWLQFPSDYNMAAMAAAGQFVSLYSKDGSRILPRPISICEIDSEGAKLRLVYRVAGAGTEEFSQMQPGESIEVVGPLGNGFTQKDGRAILIGGGIGIPPMLQLSKTLSEQGVQVQVVLGYRDGNLFLKSEFEKYGAVYVSTEDGSAGVRGNVIDAIQDAGIAADMIYACGPIPMLRGVKAYAVEQGIPAQISMEERMACGIGACLACVCQSRDIDSHSNVHNKRICKDGPVFNAEEIEL